MAQQRRPRQALQPRGAMQQLLGVNQKRQQSQMQMGDPDHADEVLRSERQAEAEVEVETQAMAMPVARVADLRALAMGVGNVTRSGQLATLSNSFGRLRSTQRRSWIHLR